MSGDLVVLEAEITSVPYQAISRLSTTMVGLPGFALIGGLAVIARLGQAHRATNDIDAVSDDQVGLLDILVAGGSNVEATACSSKLISSSTSST